jgi:hypothetical protein
LHLLLLLLLELLLLLPCCCWRPVGLRLLLALSQAGV